MKRLMNVAILGSTGSIGKQALEVVARFPDQLRVVALAANTNAQLIAEQARSSGATHIAMGSKQAYERLVEMSLSAGIRCSYGLEALEEIAALDEVDIVLNALVGARGLRVSYTALRLGKRLALANKESLVVGGDILMPLVHASPRTDALMPIDSEHSALLQCLLGEHHSEVDHLWLTASGGPFRGKTRAELATVTRQAALAHPTWSMGPKITIDSSTLMNKGLEAIEAHHLFSMPYERIKVLIHPQSCIHSMVAYKDGSIKAHLGVTDMRIPIQYALSYPERWSAPTSPLDLTNLFDLTFEQPDVKTFGCLALAFEAGQAGGTAPAVLNAANEVAVAAFLDDRCDFLAIEHCIKTVLAKHTPQPVESLEHLELTDAWARVAAQAALGI